MNVSRLSSLLLSASLLGGGCQIFISASEEELVEVGHCADGVDNDGDSQIDCADLDCDEVCPDFCGDGFTKAPEQCDDGNNSNLDGCDGLCQVELLLTCGNSVVEAGEVCDDGNVNNLDACLAICRSPACSDGISLPGEECHNDASTLNSGEEPHSVAAFDLEGDSDLDLATADFGAPPLQSVLTIYQNDGAGVFTRFQLNAGVGPIDIEAADLNEDTLPDLVVANFGGNGADVSLFINDGAGSFLEQQTFGAGPNTVSIAVADLNNDTHLDLAAVSFLNNVLCVLTGDGLGGFATNCSLATGEDPTGVAIADFDNNGELDLATADQAGNSVSVFLQSGGAFGARQAIPGGLTTRHITTADLDLDGALDLITAERGRGVDLLFGNGDGSFQARQTLPLGAAANTFAVTTADVNNDGRLDVVAANNNADNVAIFLATAGAFEGPKFLAGIEEPTFVLAAELDGQPTLDLVVTSRSSQQALGALFIYIAAP